MPSWSSVDTYKRWKYAVKTDFHGLDDQATELKTINLTYDSCDRFLPFDRSPQEADIKSAIDCNHTVLALAIGSDLDVYDLKTGKQGVFLGHADPVSKVAFLPGQSNKLVSWSNSDFRIPRSDANRNGIVFWNIDVDLKEDRVQQDEMRRVETASKSSVEHLQSLLDEQNLNVVLQDAEKGVITNLLRDNLNQIVRQHSASDNVKLEGRLCSSFQAPLFNHAGDTLIYLPGPRPRSNGDDRWDIGLYHMPSGTTKTLTGHRDAIMWIGFSPDDSLVVSACWDGSFRVWDAGTGEQKHKWVTDKQNWAGAFRPDGTQFLGTDGNGAIRIWDLQTGEVMAKYEKGQRWRRYLDWSSDGRYIAVGGEVSGEITLFDTRILADTSGRMEPIQTRVLDVRGVSEDEMIQHMVSSSLAVYSVRWEGNGRRLFSATYGEVALEIDDFELKVKWRIIPFERTDDQEADWERLPKSSIRGQPYRPDYSYLASSDEIALVCHDGVRFWRLHAAGR
jgi:WD40 repeat protein